MVKFLPNKADDDDPEYFYETALEKWLLSTQEDMEGKILWPENSADAGDLVRKEAAADPDWPVFNVLVMRYYGE